MWIDRRLNLNFWKKEYHINYCRIKPTLTQNWNKFKFINNKLIDFKILDKLQKLFLNYDNS